MRARDESGQLTILVIGFATIAVLVVGVVVNASHAFLQRRSLASWADGAVTAAAQSVSYGDLYAGGVADSVPLDEADARAAVADYAARNDLGGRFDDFRVERVDVDATTGRVSVEVAADVPLVLMEGAAAVTITAEASAIAVVR